MMTTSWAVIDKRLTSIEADVRGRLAAPSLSLPVDPVDFAIAAGVTPDPWQAEVLRSPSRNSILCCSRQSGKSLVTAVMATHQATTIPDSLIAIFSPTLAQSQELYEKIRELHQTLAAEAPSAVEESAMRLKLANGSRITCRPAKDANVRGLSSVALLIVDEASRVPDPLYRAIRPMILVSRGRVMLLSTPWGQRGFFYDEWAHGGADWHRVKVTAAECPRIDPAELVAERRRIPSWFAQQEYDCEFVDDETQMIPTDLVRAALSSDVTPLEVTLP